MASLKQGEWKTAAEADQIDVELAKAVAEARIYVKRWLM